MLPVTVNVRRTLVTGVVLLALSLAGSFATNAFLNGTHESEITANVPNALVVFSSFVLLTLQLLGTVLIGTVVVVWVSQSTKIERAQPETRETQEDIRTQTR